MALPSPLYIAFQGLQTYFSDKDTATALSGGEVKFFSDVNRSVPKDVYQQVQLMDNTYDFVNAGNEIPLNAAGAFSSPTDGTDMQVYAYPFENPPEEDNPGGAELYYLEIYDADGVLQFTREAQPANAVNFQNLSTLFLETDNQISNPQFVEVNFTTPSTTFSVTGSNTVTNIAPDWDIITSGTGTLTVSQNPISSLPLDGNPPYVLGITSVGLSGSIVLRQKFQGNPRLFLNGFVSGTALIRSQNLVSVPFTMKYFPLFGTSIVFNIFEAVMSANDSSYSTAKGTVETDSSAISGIVAPSGYSEIQISFPSNIQVYLSNIQVISVSSPTLFPNFAEQSTARQIDHLYHYAYPIVPIGTIIDYFGFLIPSHYLLCDYSTYNRITYSQLFNTITIEEEINLVNTFYTFESLSPANYFVGMGVEGTGIPPFTTITAISSTTITMSQAATATRATLARFFAAANRFSETVTWASSTTFAVASGAAYYVGQAVTGVNIPTATLISSIATDVITISNASSPPYSSPNTSVVYFYSPGNGDGSTTFNVPDARRRVMVGSGGAVISAAPLGVSNQFGSIGGEEAHLQVNNEVGPHVHGPFAGQISYHYGGTGTTSFGSGSSSLQQESTTGPVSYTSGSQTAFNVMQPSLITKKCIRYE